MESQGGAFRSAQTAEHLSNPQPPTDSQPEPSVKQPSPSIQTTAQQLTDQTLKFLSTASNETLGACLFGLGTTTYLVLGRVGLVLIGVVGGVVLHATWEGSFHEASKAEEENRKKEVGLDVARRVLKWRRQQTGAEGDEDESAVNMELDYKQSLDFTGFRPETEMALKDLTDSVIRDYVQWWYSPIIPKEMSFPATCRHTLTSFLLSMSAHLSRKRPADTFLDFLTNSSSIVIVFLNELSSATAASPNSPCADAVRTYLEMKPEGSLAHILDAKHQQKKLDLVAQDILSCYLEHKSYDSEPVRVFCQQILSHVILEMTIDSCSKPEFINGWIVYLLEDGEPELLKDIDVGLEGLTSATTKASIPGISQLDGVMDESQSAKDAEHRRTMSKAQEAMDDAMREAQHLSQLIAEDDARRLQEHDLELPTTSAKMRLEDGSKTEASDASVRAVAPSSSSMMTDDTSGSTTEGVATPTSSQSDAAGEHEGRLSREDLSNPEKQEQNSERANVRGSMPSAPFTNFDQLPTHQGAREYEHESNEKVILPLSLHNASISIFDDTDPSDRSSLRKKPEADYLIQIEPISSHYPGWMIVRKYADFETLHEIIRRIASISGAGVFLQAHATLPNFKVHTKASLREALERYILDAIRFKPLADSEGMRRFLEKERGLDKSPGAKGGFGWPTPNAFENMGKGMMDVLTKAPKDVAGGGKALIGGVSGVLGNKKKQSISNPSIVRSSTTSPSGPARIHNHLSSPSQISLSRASQDSLRRMSAVVDTQPAPIAQMERIIPELEAEMKPRPSSSINSRTASVRQSMESTPVLGGDQIIQLPPPPSDIPDDYNPATIPSTTASVVRTRTQVGALDEAPAVSTVASRKGSSVDVTKLPGQDKTSTKAGRAKSTAAISEQETQVAVELLFATIQELYTLSSAWTLRRTLLTAAKTFLLRPGNPQLESIRQLLQTTVLDANTSDIGIATHLRKLRMNALPTEEELKAWPPDASAEEKEELRIKARKLLVERGMPQALTSVMGMAASGEALGKVFDCLQVQSVARGLMFGLILQGLRAVTQ